MHWSGGDLFELGWIKGSWVCWILYAFLSQRGTGSGLLASCPPPPPCMRVRPGILDVAALSWVLPHHRGTGVVRSWFVVPIMQMQIPIIYNQGLLAPSSSWPPISYLLSVPAAALRCPAATDLVVLLRSYLQPPHPPFLHSTRLRVAVGAATDPHYHPLVPSRHQPTLPAPPVPTLRCPAATDLVVLLRS
jgi:hypothetical protein